MGNAFVCESVFENQPSQGVAVYCSDGRFADHFDEFVTQSLGLTCCDRIVIPGGPAYLADHPGVEADGASLLEQIKFMVEAHNLNRVILIMHEDCGCYSHKLGYPAGPEQQQRQADDLAMAVHVVRDVCPNVSIECYIALIDGDQVQFQGGQV